MINRDPTPHRSGFDVVAAYVAGTTSLAVALEACRALSPARGDPESPEEEREAHFGIDPETLTGDQRTRLTELLEALDATQAGGGRPPAI
jgi:hypothetical protein